MGKDRAGIVAMLILLSLGKEPREVFTDYYASALPYYMSSESAALVMEENGYPAELSERVREFLGIGAEMIPVFESWWRGNSHGDYFSYLTENLGLSEEDIRTLREKYLEKKF